MKAMQGALTSCTCWKAISRPKGPALLPERRHGNAPSRKWQQGVGYLDKVAAKAAAPNHAPFISEQEAGGEAARGPPPRKLGLLQGVPTVHDPEDTLSGARRRAERVAKSKTIKNQKELACNWGTRSIDEMTRNLTDPLKLYVSRFPPPARLHPFESELLDLSIGVQRYATAVQNVNSLRKSISATGKEAMARAARASSKNDALSLREQGFETLASAWRKGSKSVTSLKEVAKVLRKLPVVDLGAPIVALVGAPNVGKSSMVNFLSSGRPEVCNYPFTTRDIKMGHFYVGRRVHQVTDTPGLLARDDVDRNTMEKLTLAVLEKLPSVPVFVLDVTEECGTSLEQQAEIRDALRERLPGKQWIDVASKEDLLTASQRAAAKRISGGVIFVSSVTGEGMSALQEAVISAVEEVSADGRG